MKEDRKLINSKLVFCKTQKDLTWRDLYQGNQKKTQTYQDPNFGIRGYSVPDSKLKDFSYKIPAISYGKEHKNADDHYLDQHQKNNKWKPPCVNKHDDWAKPKFIGGGKFLKGPRTTFTASVMIENQRRPKPGPGAHTLKDLTMVKAAPKSGSKAEKILEFIEQAKWEAMQAPGPGNRHDKIDFKWTEKKPRAASMHAESEKQKEKDSRLVRI